MPVHSHGDDALDFLRRHPGGAVEALGAGEVEVGFVDRNNLYDGREVVELLAVSEALAAVIQRISIVLTPRRLVRDPPAVRPQTARPMRHFGPKLLANHFVLPSSREPLSTALSAGTQPAVNASRPVWSGSTFSSTMSGGKRRSRGSAWAGALRHLNSGDRAHIPRGSRVGALMSGICGILTPGFRERQCVRSNIS